MLQVENRGLKLKSDIEDVAASTAIDISAPSADATGSEIMYLLNK
jgi:hypothetical protein